jgi:hypothetical protein
MNQTSSGPDKTRQDKTKKEKKPPTDPTSEPARAKLRELPLHPF